MAWVVNGETVDEDAVREEMRGMRPRYEQEFADMDPIEAEMQLRDWARENVIERILLRQSAAADPEPVPQTLLEAALEEARTRAGGQVGCGIRTSDEEIRTQAESELRIQRLLARLYATIAPVKPKEINAFYKSNREQFLSGERVHAKHIVKNVGGEQEEAAARTAIEEAYARLRKGEAFEDVADRYSDCAGNGGDLGWFPRGEMVEEFDRIVFGLSVGETSPVFRTSFGFHIAKVYERRPKGYLALDDVKDAVAQTIAEARQQEALASYLDALRAKASVRRV